MSDNIRLLVCGHCKSIEMLPDYEGPVERDFLLDNLVRRHQFADGRPHGPATLGKVAQTDWDNPEAQKAIVKQLQETLLGGETGLGTPFYETRDTFKADAFQCWQQHNRTKNCTDYKSDSKLLTPNTEAERRAAGLPPLERGPMDMYLCHFCPFHQVALAAAQKRAGIIN
jgi:hypothetical protein